MVSFPHPPPTPHPKGAPQPEDREEPPPGLTKIPIHIWRGTLAAQCCQMLPPGGEPKTRLVKGRHGHWAPKGPGIPCASLTRAQGLGCDEVAARLSRAVAKQRLRGLWAYQCNELGRGWSGGGRSSAGGRAQKFGRTAGRDGEPPPRGAPWDRFVPMREQTCARSSPNQRSFLHINDIL